MNTLEQAIIGYWGERCPDFDKDCSCCQAWAEFDATRTDTVKALRDAMRQAMAVYHADEASNVGEAMFEVLHAALSHPEPVAQEAVALPHLDMGEFKPCIVINEEVGLTEAIFEDTAYIAEPVFPGAYHWIDKHIAVEDGRLVGLTVWRTAPAHPSPSPEQGEETGGAV